MKFLGQGYECVYLPGMNSDLNKAENCLGLHAQAV